MSKLTAEQHNELPDFIKGDYVEKDGSFVHAGLAKVKGTANELDAQKNGIQAELDEYKSQEQARIDAAKQEAYDKAIADKDIEGITAQTEEKIEHARKSSFEAGRKEAQKEFNLQAAKGKADNLALKIAGEVAVDEYAMDMLKREFLSQIDVNPDSGDVTFLDGDGRATTLNKDEFKVEVLKNPRYSRLIKEDSTTSGGGNANGSNGGRAPSKKFSEYSGAELVAIKKQDPAAYEQLKLTR